MEKEMTSLFLIPSLYTGASMSAVVHLWSQQLYRNRCTNRKEMLSNPAELKDEIYRLLIPTHQKRMLLSFVDPITKYLDHWLAFWLGSLHKTDEPIKTWLDKLNLTKNMRVTLMGTVDGKATAKEILDSGSLSNEEAFRLACINCMMDEVMSLWPVVKSYFFQKVYNSKDDSSKECSEVIVFSQYANVVKTNENENMHSFVISWKSCSNAWYELAIRTAVKVGNAVSLDFFLKKITSDSDRQKIVHGVAESMFYKQSPQNAVSICLVISRMGPEKWYYFVQNHAKEVFLTFTTWPLWMFFFEMVLESRRYLTSKELFVMLAGLVEPSASTLSPTDDYLLDQVQAPFATDVAPSVKCPIDDYLVEQVKILFEALWKDTSQEQKLEVIQLLLEYDAHCLIRVSSSSPTNLLRVMRKSSWVFEQVFKNEEALYNFLHFGFRQNSTCLRETLYKYLPSCKDSEEVKSMLDMYEEETHAPESGAREPLWWF